VTVTEWDPYAPEALADPPASWVQLRERCPVARTERMGGFWAGSRYDDVVAIARDSRRFNNSGGPQFGTSRRPSWSTGAAGRLRPARW
jgi:cytochrome P450